MRPLRRPSVESVLTASTLALIGLVGGWAAGAWETGAPAREDLARLDDAMLAQTTPAPAPGYGPAPEPDTRADVPDVCSRRVGCLLR